MIPIPTKFSFPGLGIVKTSATSQWAFDSENNDMTAVTKKPQDARELKLSIDTV